MTIIEALECAQALLEQDGWEEGDIIYDDLDLAIARLRQKHPDVANEEIREGE